MGKIISLLLVIVIVLMLKNMYLSSNTRKHVRKPKLEDNSFPMGNFNVKDIIMSSNVPLVSKGRKTKLLPKGCLEIITKDGSTTVPVAFNENGQYLIGS